MKNIFVAGVILIVLGAAILGYDQFSYTTQDKVLQVGPLTATAETTHTISLPRTLGWLLVAGGTGMLIFGAGSRKS